MPNAVRVNVKNKDKAFDESKMQFNYNITCDVVVSDTIHACSYNSFEEFYADVCVKWEECFYNIIQKMCGIKNLHFFKCCISFQ